MRNQSMRNAVARRDRAMKKFQPFAKTEKLIFSKYEIGFEVGDLKPGISLDEIPVELHHPIATHEVFVFRVV